MSVTEGSASPGTRTAPRYVGTSLPRKEDPALLTGRGSWTGDITPAGTLHLAMVRSPHPHARITGIDTAAARAHPGVTAVLTGADVDAEFLVGIPCGWPVTEDIKVPDHRPLATSEVNHVGDGVAVVLADSAAAARDAADLVEVDYETLPAVVDVADALVEGAPLVHDELGTNHTATPGRWPPATWTPRSPRPTSSCPGSTCSSD